MRPATLLGPPPAGEVRPIPGCVQQLVRWHHDGTTSVVTTTEAVAADLFIPADAAPAVSGV